MNEIIEKLKILAITPQYPGLTSEECNYLVKVLTSVDFRKITLENSISEFEKSLYENFDFEKVEKVMEALDWIWADTDPDTPKKSDMIEMIGSLFNSLKERILQIDPNTVKREDLYTYFSCGGFTVECFIPEDLNFANNIYSVTFEVEQFDNEE